MSEMATARGMQMGIPVPLHGRITEIRAALALARGRTVTYPETLEYILDAYDALMEREAAE